MGWRFTTPSRRGYQISNPLRSANKKAAFETSRRLTAFLLRAAKPVLLHVKHCAGCYPNQGAFVNVIKIGVFS